MTYEIIPLPKAEWEGTVIPMRYTTEEYYDVTIDKTEDGYVIGMKKERFDKPVSHYPEEYDFPDKLYQPHWEKAYAWGIVGELTEDGHVTAVAREKLGDYLGADAKTKDNPYLLACIESCPEEWSNRLMVTELWVHEDLRRQGIAHRLMAIVKEQAILEHRRAIILETQSCNVGAISFYESEGFTPIGMDSCCYSNRDLERKEVRINMGYFFRKPKVDSSQIEIRRERPEEYHAVEQATLNAFWNKYRIGCDEHQLVHKLRDSEDYLPEISRIAVIDGEIAGVICYTRVYLRKEVDGNVAEKEIVTFGPLGVVPKWQGCGVGEVLLKETLKLAKDAGYEGVVIFGEPDYYPRVGFKTCDNFGITDAEGNNFDAFMGYELIEGGLSGFGGRYIEAEVFATLNEEDNEILTREFVTPAKMKFPCQW